MALTPEDVVNKRFQPTKFREGYDQDEVDDFLDEIVVELRRLTGENETLRRRLSELGEDANVVAKEQSVPAPVSAAPAAKPAEEKKAEAKPAEEAKATPAPAAKPAEEKKVEAAPAAKPAEKKVEAAPVAAPAVAPSAESAANVLAMAQRLHDEYVASGVEQRDKIISDAKTEANSLVTSAEEKSRKTLSALEQQKSVLERKLEQLRGFERDYRARLKTYIEGQLRDLESQGSIDGAAGKAN
ncbi:DivIVA domain-containing protein [Glutamicibacter protophormiae]|uniref:Cell wall synthesis protein Wag31 n=1 Tax=Glutamicibacter protophormiae TaxID=37930 RepID=A0ABS4XUA2_GLUPR|nr:DivIVA domain-containing protein [Glutamicibacter protophormiae]MBP2400099.1 DivIVA domain-containing protein [Glutamicibacter protophormiae]QRQ77429.1 DivIVA domain-containing protein [Glutamicibacter protophormiae]WPR63411.1 DivIVA domain-containing protein [Glutamicibacter protophormiae]WPR66907.1 DivIVA domain-containing protein [Glutamicibacter protophormiae]GGL75220.1 cell division protein DivIVA [Glutamicibacter protophormiae]